MKRRELERRWRSGSSSTSVRTDFTERMSPLPAIVADRDHRDAGTKWRRFGFGLAVRLLGLVLIWLGDGSPNAFRKALVIVGVVLSIGGIAVLRYLLISGFRRVPRTVGICPRTVERQSESPRSQSGEPSQTGCATADAAGLRRRSLT